MNIFITGASGMLADAVIDEGKRLGHTFIASDLRPLHSSIQFLDIRDADAVTKAIAQAQPDFVFHLGAETDVDLCERDPKLAYDTNREGTRHVAQACKTHNLPLVYISTAGVFDGKKETAYEETDPAIPINVYGASKYEGEGIVRQLVEKHFIVRAGWMIGGRERDKKFVGKIMDQLRAGAKTIYAVDDKLGAPTYTVDFARTLFKLVETQAYGLYHMACQGVGTRCDVAHFIISTLGKSDVQVVPVPSSHFQESYPTLRPRSEWMINAQLEKIGQNHMRNWQEALKEYLVDSEGIGINLKSYS